MPPQTLIIRWQYFLYFGVLGIVLPWFNLYCYHLGFSGMQIGVLTGVRSAVTVLFALAWGLLADRYRARRGIFILCSLLSAVAWGGYLRTDDFGLMLGVTVAYGIFYAPLISFLEAFSMELLGRRKTSYGRLRVWGSLSFILTVLAVGRLVDHHSIRIILWLVLAGSLAQAAISLRMPRTETDPRKGGRRTGGGILRPLRTPRMAVFLLSAFLMLFSHGTYYGFFSIHLENLGLDRGFIGLAWALGSVSEILVMVGSRRIFQRFDLERVLLFSLLAAALRWGLLAVVSSPAALLATQLLHAVTYGAFHVASILYTDALMPPESKTLGQSVNNAVTYGLGLIAGFLVSGWLFEPLGSGGLFMLSAAVALTGALVFAFRPGRGGSTPPGGGR